MIVTAKILACKNEANLTIDDITKPKRGAGVYLISYNGDFLSYKNQRLIILDKIGTLLHLIIEGADSELIKSNKNIWESWKFREADERLTITLMEKPC
jgi:hypothetical protein